MRLEVKKYNIYINSKDDYVYILTNPSMPDYVKIVHFGEKVVQYVVDERWSKRIAFGYTRVSTEEQTYGASLENQRLAIQKYANQNDIEIIGWYTDAGISAKTAHVIVYNISRISHDMTSFFNDIGKNSNFC